MKYTDNDVKAWIVQLTSLKHSDVNITIKNYIHYLMDKAIAKMSTTIDPNEAMKLSGEIKGYVNLLSTLE